MLRCVMTTEIILAATLMSLSIGERQQRSTVLTDESKRVLEHFDFSNFDKQEALNYIDRQRYENQIRGKRSQTKLKREQNEKDGIEENDLNQKEPEPEPEAEPELQPQFDTDIWNNNDDIDLSLEPEPGPEPGPRSKQSPNLKKQFMEGQVDVKPFSIKPLYEIENREPKSKLNDQKNGKGRLKKKKKSSLNRHNHDDNYLDEEENEYETRRHRKTRKKKKRHYWDHWSQWSPCSVTCGRGRKIRWRKCIAKNCTTGELEMGEKTCQLPACNLLTKLLGL